LLKASENPPIIWPEDKSVVDFTEQWWVVHTKSRNEKALAHDLISREVSYFLPMSWKARKSSRRTVRSLLPLFNGYLFFCGSEEHRIQLLQTNRAAGLIPVVDQQQLIHELAQIEQALRAGAPLVPDNYIEKGRKCRVIAGPLMGLTGIVIEQKNATRLVLQVDMLGQAASVEIDVDLIEVVEQ
jgi:transcription antitermination factor NusG